MSITIEDVRKKLIEIDASKSDYQAAHGIEDDLWGQVLEAIATGAENAKELAQEALKSRDIEFSRYRA